MLQGQKLELSYFSLQLLEYLIHNHPHRANDYDFIKLRGDQAAEVFERALAHGSLQDLALEDANEELYKGLYFSFYAMIKDVLWEEFSNFIPAENVDDAAKDLIPILSHLHKPFDPIDTEASLAKDAELDAIDEDELRLKMVFEIKRIIAQGYGI